MQRSDNWHDPVSHLVRHQPDDAIFYVCPAQLQANVRRFIEGFPGLVTYAVKANPGEEVLANFVAAGLRAFDVASPKEMVEVRALCPDAVLHYNNPVRSAAEIEVAARIGVASCSVDDGNELAKLAPMPRGMEVAVRFALPVKGAAYDFGAKFGATPERAVTLLQEAVRMGFAPALTFHPGTQCADAAVWEAYIASAAWIAREAGIRIKRLNVGGGFASNRGGVAPDLEEVFTRIGRAVEAQFGFDAPALICEPGRALVADAFTLACRVKGLRENGTVFLNEGIYGGLNETRDLGVVMRRRVISPEGRPRGGTLVPRVVFGPTCDSIDRLPGDVLLPEEMQDGDYILFDGMGAYSRCLLTGFNGYFSGGTVTVAELG